MEDLIYDCFGIMCGFLSARDLFSFACCSNEMQRRITNDICWKHLIPLSRPSWISSDYIFAKKLQNKSAVKCMKCNERVNRFCILSLCACSSNQPSWSTFFPRWHDACILPTKRNRFNRNHGVCSCPICKEKIMFIKITSYP
jgi:hypothetical protein